MRRKLIVDNQSGGVLVIVAVMLVVLLGMTAFAIDIGHLMVVRNELRNAADAGALAGARMLYSSVSGTVLTINTGANAVAIAASTANASDGSAVEVPVVERGHWCFTCGPDGSSSFIANESVSSYNLTTGASFEDLEADTNYINAVRVVASRSAAASFFAGILDPLLTSFSLSAEAIAWKSFAGTNIPVDQPLAICIESVLKADGTLNCTVGQMTPSGSDTAAWTNLVQGMDGAADANSTRALVCNDEAIQGHPIDSGAQVSTTNGLDESVFETFYDCWSDKSPDKPWELVLPLIQCGDGTTPGSMTNPGPTNMVVGALRAEIFWIRDNGNEPKFNNIPRQYDADPDTEGMEYVCPQTCTPEPCPSLATEEGRKRCWANFLNAVLLKDAPPETPGITVNAAADMYQPVTIYFKPSCELVEAAAGTGGVESSVLAEFPKLVR